MEEEKNKFVMKYYKFLYYIASLGQFRSYQNKDDLFQVGVVGLLKAKKLYNENMGIKFTTYAYKYIFGEMYKFMRMDKGIKVGRDLYSLASKIEKITNLLTQKLYRSPSIREISEAMGVDEFTIVSAIKTNSPISSMEEMIYGEENDLVLGDYVKDDSYQDTDEMIMIHEEMNSLTDFERNLIEKRYFSDLTQSETAKVLGISQVQVSRKEGKILEKMRTNIAA
jgi:RNA polymerase sigma factor, sigma-70 family